VVTDNSGNLAVSIIRVEASTAVMWIVHIQRKEGISQEERAVRNVGEEKMLSRSMGTKEVRPGYRMELLMLLLWKVTAVTAHKMLKTTHKCSVSQFERPPSK
jgi:hypothetical protein